MAGEYIHPLGTKTILGISLTRARTSTPAGEPHPEAEHPWPSLPRRPSQRTSTATGFTPRPGTLMRTPPCTGCSSTIRKTGPAGVPEEPSQEREEHRCREPLGEHHEGQLPPVSDRRDRIAPTPGSQESAPAVPGTALPRDRSASLPPPPRKSTRGPAGPLRGSGDTPIQPPLDCLRIPLVRPPQWCLGRKPPAPQAAPHGPRGEGDPSAVEWGRARLPGPQGEGKFHLIGTAIDNQPVRSRILVWLELDL